MTMVVGQQVMTVEVKPPLPQRTQMWARLAGQAVSFDEINVVYTAFFALWWEADAAESFEKAATNLQEDDMQWTIEWLGHTVFELEKAVEGWQRMSELLALDALGARRLSRFVKDTSAHLQELMQLVVSLRGQAVAFCEMSGMPLPERLRETAPVVSDVVEA